MNSLFRTFRKLNHLVRRSSHDRALAEEMEAHREMLEQDCQDRGDTSAKNAARQMGNLTLTREESRELWGFRVLESIAKDLRHALRGLFRTPAFTTIAIASLALGIGANTAIFSFVDAILLKHLSVPESGRLVRIAERGSDGHPADRVLRMATVDELAQRASSLSGVFGWFPKQISFSRGNSAQWILGELVTGQYFQTLQVKPALGRLLTEEDVRNAGANPVCVISDEFWKREFTGDPSVLTMTVSLNRHPYRIVGVTERGFYGAALQQRSSLQVPATRIGDFMPAFSETTNVSWLRTLSWLSPMARLKTGITTIEAQSRTGQLLQEIELQSEGHRSPDKQSDLLLQDGSQGFNDMQSFERPVLVLMAVAGLVLLATCANLANLLLARGQSRAREFSVRLAIGASRERLIRQLLVESLVLALVGGVIGILLSFWITRTLDAFLNAGKSDLSMLQVKPDVSVLAFSIAATALTAILFGLLPAWHSTQPKELPGLNHELLTTGRFSGLMLRRMLVVLQIVLSLVVVFFAALLSRALLQTPASSSIDSKELVEELHFSRHSGFQ